MSDGFKDPAQVARAALAMKAVCDASGWKRSTAEYHQAVHDHLTTAADRIEALETDLNTAIAAAYEAAADFVDGPDASLMSKHMLAGAIRALTPADAIAARDADRARVRREALEEVRNRILGFTMIVPPNNVPMREACESIRGQAARVIRAMIEEEGNG